MTTYRTSDVGEAEAHLRAQYGELSLSNEPLEFEQRLRGDSVFGIAEFEYGGRLSVGGEIEMLTVVSAPSGAYDWQIGDVRGVGGRQPVLFQPGRHVVCHIDHIAMRAVTFDLPELTRTAAALFADDGIALDFSSPRAASPRLERMWDDIVGLVPRTPERDSGLLLASARSALGRLVLAGFRLTDERLRRRADGVARWNAYRRAVAFIEEHASLPITISDIASAAGVSRVELDRAFREHSREAVTVLGHLRRVRLAAARGDLLASDPSTTSIEWVALRWGFASFAGFERMYRQEFGVDPSADLARD